MILLGLLWLLRDFERGRYNYFGWGVLVRSYFILNLVTPRLHNPSQKRQTFFTNAENLCWGAYFFKVFLETKISHSRNPGLKNQKFYLLIPVAILTGHEDTKIEKEAIRLAAAAYSFKEKDLAEWERLKKSINVNLLLLAYYNNMFNQLN